MSSSRLGASEGSEQASAAGLNRSPIPLAPQLEIRRALSTTEYYYAAVGSGAHSLDQLREIVFVVEGCGSLPPAVWRQALDVVTRVHPGARLRLVGSGPRARWQSDGQVPRLRIVPDCRWDGQSKAGSEFITAEPLSLADGLCCELIVAECDRHSRVIFRVLHAVMDGRGGLYFLQELFRALRQETPQGINSALEDFDLMRRLVAEHDPSDRGRIKRHRGQGVSLTGGPQGDETGDTWRRLSLRGPQRDIVPRVAAAMAEFAQNDSGRPMLFNIPVDLRRHVPELQATTMFTSFLPIPLYAGEGAAEFKQILRGCLAARAELPLRSKWFLELSLVIFNALKLLPFSWMDRLFARNIRNYRQLKRRWNSSVISNLGRIEAGAFICPGFQPDAFYFYSEQESTYCMLSSLDDRSELIIGMPRIYASNGRLEALMRHLEQRLGTPAASRD